MGDERILITGATGFLGTNLLEQLLLSDSTNISIIKKQEPFKKPWLEKILKKVKVYELDIRNLEETKKIIKDIAPEKIFHLAAFVNPKRSLTTILEAIQHNILGTFNVLSSLENIDYKVFINISTSEVYGNNPTPFKETQIPNPVSPYSVSKYSAEMFCNLLYKLYGYPIVTLRLFNLYGEYDISSRIIPDSIIACLMKKELKLTSGKQTRDFNYVKDVVDGILKASDVESAIGEIINIGSGEEHSIRFVVEKIIELMGNPIKPSFGAFDYRKNEVWRMSSDNTKAKKILGYNPKFSLEEGLKRTIGWYEKNIDFINQNKLI